MKRRGEPKAVDDLGYPDKRQCLHCGGGFTPAATVCGTSSENYCAPACAWAAYKQAQGE